MHFIFFTNPPKRGVYEEKHTERTDVELKNYFTDKKMYLYTLILNPDNSFEILIDQSIVNSGNLLSEMTSAINASREIEVPEDWKPEIGMKDPKYQIQMLSSQMTGMKIPLLRFQMKRPQSLKAG